VAAHDDRRAAAEAREIVEETSEDRPALHLQHRLGEGRSEAAEVVAGAGRQNDRGE